MLIQSSEASKKINQMKVLPCEIILKDFMQKGGYFIGNRMTRELIDPLCFAVLWLLICVLNASGKMMDVIQDQ